MKTSVPCAAAASSGDPTCTALRSRGIQPGTVPRGQCSPQTSCIISPGLKSRSQHQQAAQPGEGSKVKLPALTPPQRWHWCCAVINRWDTKGALRESYLHANQMMFP